MSLTIEGDPNSATNKFPLLLDTDWIRSIGIAWLFKESRSWCALPRLTGNESLFYNAVFFVRLGLPFLFCASIRWSGSTTSRAVLQFCVGFKLNGRAALSIRIQSDASSAAGSSGPNYGQAAGFNYGTH